jgi:hypothetical protein
MLLLLLLLLRPLLWTQAAPGCQVQCCPICAEQCDGIA